MNNISLRTFTVKRKPQITREIVSNLKIKELNKKDALK
jgi:hypothetical protein